MSNSGSTPRKFAATALAAIALSTAVLTAMPVGWALTDDGSRQLSAGSPPQIASETLEISHVGFKPLPAGAAPGGGVRPTHWVQSSPGSADAVHFNDTEWKYISVRRY
jgi:hypothetical protein